MFLAVRVYRCMAFDIRPLICIEEVYNIQYNHIYKSHVYTYVPSLTHTNGRACRCAGEPDPAADPVAHRVDRTPQMLENKQSQAPGGSIF